MLPLMLLVLLLCAHAATPQRPLNANGTILGNGSNSPTLVPQLRAYSKTFTGGGGVNNGVSSGHTGNGNTDYQPQFPSSAVAAAAAAGHAPTNRKLSSRQQPMNALDGARPSASQTSGSAVGTVVGGDTLNEEAIAYGSSAYGGGAGGGGGSASQQQNRRKTATYGVTNHGGGRYGTTNEGSLGGMSTLYHMRRNKQQQPPPPPPQRQRDEALFTTPLDGPKNPLSVLKSIFKNDVSLNRVSIESVKV